MRIPVWAQHYSLDEAIETLPMKMGDLDTVQAGFIVAGLPDPYGDRRYTLSEFWRQLPIETREILNAAYEQDLVYRAIEPQGS